MNEHDSDTFARFARRFAAIEADVKDPSPLAVRRGTMFGLRRSPRSLSAVIAVVVLVAAVAAFGPLIADQMKTGPPASSSAVGASSASPSSTRTPTPTQAPTVVPAPTVAPAPIVVCGRIAAEPCDKAIGLVREGHPREVAAAWAIVVDDVCAPTVICDRLYPFMSAVVLVPTPGSSTEPQPFLVVGKDYWPERVEAWTGTLPKHIVALIQGVAPRS